MISPSPLAASVMIIIQITFKSLIDVKHAYETRIKQRLTRFK
jgi:hypothetical protein